MALIPGTRIGLYEVAAQIGVGGMGEVYRATDTNLGRQVAIKVLPEPFAQDAERLARFEREAKTLASLNHPHIAQIYGFEKYSGVHALVMELVEGPTLADRIALGPIPIDEALPIAKQTAEALEAAHEQGIIHRDLKPANIKVRSDGTVKVLDFGLAKVTEPAAAVASNVTLSPTITTPAMTRMGMIIGTAAYMSPEQAKGRPADKRGDIWAFGCVLYEMLTGGRAFAGDDVAEVLAAVIKSDVDWNRLENVAPVSIHTLLRRCLRKEPRQRLGDAGAVRIEIEEAITAPAETLRSSPRRKLVPLSVALLIGLVGGAAASGITAWLRTRSPSPTASDISRVELALPSGMELTDGASAVISPDGTRVAYVGSRGGISQLYIRSIKEVEGRPLANTQRAVGPFFAPDGIWLGFFADGRLKKVSTASGVVVDLAETGGPRGLAGAWSSTDTIVYPGPNGLAEIAASGGASRPLLTPEQIAAHGGALFPEFLPGGDMLLVSSSSGDATEDRSIDLLTLRTGERRVLVQGGVLPRYLPTGHLVFLREGALMAVRFDVEGMESVGAPVEVLAGVRQTNFFGAFSCSRDGRCVYIAGGTGTERRTVTLVDRAGNVRPLSLPPRSYRQPRFSRSGDKLSLWIGRSRCDIEVYDLARGTTTMLTSEGDNHFPVWAPDWQRIAYISRKRGAAGYELFARKADGGGSEDRLTATDRNLGPVTPLSYSPDGTLVFAHRGDLWSLSRSDTEPRAFAPSRFNESAPAFSPDGRWLAYVSDESNRFEVYVRPFPGPGEEYQISIDGGLEPVWDRRGRELFFRKANQLMAAEVRYQPSFSAGRARALFTGPFSLGPDRIDYDVSPDGESFVMVNAGEEDRPATHVNVIFNWFEELKRLVPTQLQRPS